MTNFNDVNQLHKVFKRDETLFISCKVTGGEYRKDLSNSLCLCCGEFFK